VNYWTFGERNMVKNVNGHGDLEKTDFASITRSQISCFGQFSLKFTARTTTARAKAVLPITAR
jgi:hypothetical protein